MTELASNGEETNRKIICPLCKNEAKLKNIDPNNECITLECNQDGNTNISIQEYIEMTKMKDVNVTESEKNENIDLLLNANKTFEEEIEKFQRLIILNKNIIQSKNAEAIKTLSDTTKNYLNEKYNDTVINGIKYKSYDLVYEAFGSRKVKLFGNEGGWDENGKKYNGDTFYSLYKDKCKLLIDNDLYDFKIEHEFKNRGEHEIKLLCDTEINNLRGMFYDCKNLKSVKGFNKLNVSKCKDFSFMFFCCSGLEDITGLRSWNVSSGQSFRYMFSHCTALREINGLRFWNVSSSQSFEFMFDRCHEIEDTKALTNWNVSSCKLFKGMFGFCSNLKDVTGLNNWFTANKVETLKTMVYRTPAFRNLTN